MSEATNFFGRHKLQAAGIVFVGLAISLPVLLFTNFEKLVKDKTLKEWLAENGWWSVAAIKFVIWWFVGCAILALIVYAVFSVISKLIERRRKPSLQIVFEDRSPFISAGKGGTGIHYQTRRVSITCSIGGTVSLKVPELRLGTTSFPNVQLRPIEHQPDYLEAGETGYWYVVQMNSEDKTIKILHKGNTTYSLGKGANFELVARCAGLTKSVWCQAKTEGDDLRFFLAEELSNLPELILEAEAPEPHNGRKRSKPEKAKPTLAVTAPPFFPGLVKLDVNVFRKSSNREDSILPVLVAFENLPTENGVKETDFVSARVTYAQAGFGEIARVGSGCWIDEPTPDVKFPLYKLKYLLIGGWYASSEQVSSGFRIFEYSRELNRPMEQREGMAAPRHLQIKVVLIPNGDHESSVVYEFELKLLGNVGPLINVFDISQTKRESHESG